MRHDVLYIMQVYEDDVIYSPLPMYHTSAGAMVTGNAILEGVSTISRLEISSFIATEAVILCDH